MKRIRREVTNFNDKTILDRWISDAKSIEPNYRIENEKLILDVVYHLFGYIESSLDIGKPIGLLGQTGIGKTLTFRVLGEMTKLFKNSFVSNEGRLCQMRYDNIFSAFTIYGEFSMKGYSALEKYINYKFITIDDLGSEPTIANHYGNQMNVMKLLIEERHLKGNITNFTSNLPMVAINEKYGERAHDRLVYDTNILEVNGTNWRLKPITK
jgi:hypothetical protein